MGEEKKRKPSAKEMEARRAKRARARRNRLIVALSIIIVAVVAIALLVCKLVGVFDTPVEVSTLSILDSGKVVCEEVTSFDESYYNKSDLKAFVKEEIKKYNDEVGSSKVKLDKISVKGSTAYAKTTYSSVKDYAAFTGIEVFAGTVKQAKKEYDFADAFVAVKGGEKGDSVDPIDITSQKKLKVLVVKENINVYVDGEILYVSDAATNMVDEHTVAISQADGNEDATQLIYIIYK